MKFNILTTWFAALALSACGGSGGSGGGGPGLGLDLPFDAQVSIASVSDWDGTASEQGDPFKDAAWSAYAGDHENTGRKQAYFSFDLADVPKTATIKSATLWLYQEAPFGLPYASYGHTVLDHMWYDPPFDDLLDKPAMVEAFEVLSTDGTEGFRKIDVTEQVMNDHDGGHAYFQVRARHIIGIFDFNGQDDYTKWSSADHPVEAQHPVLVVTYDN